jgi:hypothetical protein
MAGNFKLQVAPDGFATLEMMPSAAHASGPLQGCSGRKQRQAKHHLSVHFFSLQIFNDFLWIHSQAADKEEYGAKAPSTQNGSMGKFQPRNLKLETHPFVRSGLGCN